MRRTALIVALSLLGYALTVFLGMRWTGDGLGRSMGQALTAFPFTIFAAVMIAFFWAFAVLLFLSGVLSVLSLLGGLVLWPVKGRQAAVAWFDRVEGWEETIGHRIAGPKEVSNGE